MKGRKIVGGGTCRFEVLLAQLLRPCLSALKLRSQGHSC